MAKASEDALFKAIALFHHYDKDIAEEVSNLEDMVVIMRMSLEHIL